MQYFSRQLVSVLGQSDDAASCRSALSIYCFCSAEACCTFSCRHILSTKCSCWIKFSSRSSVQGANSIVSSRFQSSSSSSVFSALARRNNESSAIVCCPLYCGPSWDIFAVCQGLPAIDPRNSAGCKFAPCHWQWQDHKCTALPSRRNHDGGATNRQTLLKESSKRQSNAADGRHGCPVVGRQHCRRGSTAWCRRPANRHKSAAAER